VRRLNVVAVVRRVFGTLLDGPLLLRATGTWFAVLVAAGVMEATIGPGVSPVARLGVALTGLLKPIVEVIAFAACAVNIHRSILLAEPPALARFSGLEWRYIRRAIWVSLPFLLIILAIVVPLTLNGYTDALRALVSPSRPLAYAGISLVLGLVGYAVILPPALSLPAVIIGRRDFGIRDGFAAVRGNVLRLFAVYLLAEFAPSLTIRLVAEALRHGILWLVPATSVLAKECGAIVGSAETILTTVLWAAMLSFAYAGLVEGRRELVAEGPQGSEDNGI
jgi:hypothetical protein